MLYERQSRLGGQVLLAASVPSRAEFLDITRNLAAQVHRLGIDVRTGTAADAAGVRAARPDAVILATGARPARPGGPGVCTGWSTSGTCWRAGPRRAGGWWWSTNWGSTRPRRWRNCSPTGAAR